MANLQDSSGLPNTGSLDQFRQHFSDSQLSIVVGVSRRIISKELEPIQATLQGICDQLSKDNARQQQTESDLAAQVASLKRSVDEWARHVQQIDSSTRIYEEQIHQHVASVDQKAEDMATVKATAYGLWDLAWDIQRPVKIAAEWILKRCLHFERIAPKGRGEQPEKDYENIGHLFPHDNKDRPKRRRFRDS